VGQEEEKRTEQEEERSDEEEERVHAGARS
jgi:hypothetical protein